MFRLKLGDFARPLASAVFAAIVVVLYGAVQQPGFDLFSADWSALLAKALNAAFIAMIGHLGTKFVTASNGKVLGMIG